MTHTTEFPRQLCLQLSRLTAWADFDDISDSATLGGMGDMRRQRSLPKLAVLRKKHLMAIQVPACAGDLEAALFRERWPVNLVKHCG